jgi:tetratricopeptide (TPR) repeat protein
MQRAGLTTAKGSPSISDMRTSDNSDHPWQVLSPVLLGRTREMDILSRALLAAASGSAQCLILAGDAGVGKTRLLTEIQQRALADRFMVLQGNCFEQDVSFPYAMIVDVLRAFFAARNADAIRETLGPLADEMIKLLPELMWLLPEAQPTPTLDAEAEKRRLFEAVAQWLIRLAQAQPLLLILEDIHWADESSLDFLQVFLHRMAHFPILMLMTYRREDARSPLMRWLARLDREHLAHEIVINPLGRADVEAMLQAIFHLRQPVRPEFLDPIVELTEGNPFFIEEVLKSLIAAGDILPVDAHGERKPMQEIHIPRSVHEAVQRRVVQLSATARHIVLLAAVAGRRFDFDLLQALTGQEESALFQVMKELMAAQLVNEKVAGRFVFRHALTQQAIYSQALALERKGLHRLIGETLESLHVTDLDVYVGDLAYHFYTAEVWDKVLPYAQRAGEKAQQMYAPRAAVDQFSRALEAAHHLEATIPAALYQARGQAYEMLGEFEAARIDYERAGQAARQQGDRNSEWQSLIDLGFLWAARDYDRAGEYFQQALALVRTLHDPALLGHTLNRVGNWYVNIERPTEALRHHRESLDIFEELNDRRGLAETYDLLGLTTAMNGEWVACQTYYERAIALLRELDDRRGLASALAICAERGMAFYSEFTSDPSPHPDDALAQAEESLKLTREIEWRAGEAFTLVVLSGLWGARGDGERALKFAQEGLTVARDIEHHQWMTLACFALGMTYQSWLAFDLAREHLEQALALAHEIHSVTFVRQCAVALALVYGQRQDFARAQGVLDSAFGVDVPTETLPQKMYWSARVELMLAQGDAKQALSFLDQLIQPATNDVNSSVVPRWWKARGEALFSLGRLAEAEPCLEFACHSMAPYEPVAGPYHLTLGKLYQAQHRAAEADRELMTARRIIEQSAEHIPDQNLRENFLRQALALFPQPRSVTPRQRAKEQFGGLTERERQVAAFIALGKSNREIGEALFVGERTIETHVSNILSKLGFDARTQIAAWAADKGLAKTD